MIEKVFDIRKKAEEIRTLQINTRRSSKLLRRKPTQQKKQALIKLRRRLSPQPRSRSVRETRIMPWKRR